MKRAAVVIREAIEDVSLRLMDEHVRHFEAVEAMLAALDDRSEKAVQWDLVYGESSRGCG